MNRPPLEVADLVRAAGRTFIERSRKWITWQHLKVLRAIARCRTAALGGHLDECTDCGYRPAISYNSCRDRHCPKCQANARDRWLQARRKELLPTRYVHVVFTLPHELAPLALQNKKILYHLLLQTSAETLLEVARDPKHLGAEIGFFSVLHTWNQKLEHHPHAHCVVPAGGLSPDHSRWVPSHARFFLPIPVLRKVFRRKFVSALKRNFRQGKIGFHGTLKPLAHPKAFSAWLRTLYRHHWHVYSKRPFGGAEQAVRYLGHYTHRVAISNHRLVSLVDDQVTFRWRDRAHNNQEKLLPLSLDEFLRRFLLHLLPKGFVRIRHFGFLANRRRATLLPLCFQLLGAVQPSQTEPEASPAQEPSPLWLCPKCGGNMVVIERLTAAQIQLRSPPSLPESPHDTTIPISLTRCLSPPTGVVRPSCPQISYPLPTSPQTLAPTPRKIQPNPSSLSSFFAPLPLLQAFLLTPTPFNLHNCLPTGGFLQTAVSDAPRTTSRTYLRSSDGAHPIQH